MNHPCWRQAYISYDGRGQDSAQGVSHLSPGAHLLAVLKLTLINLVLSGDNAVVIALAARSLPRHLQRQAMLLGGRRDDPPRPLAAAQFRPGPATELLVPAVMAVLVLLAGLRRQQTQAPRPL